MADRYDPVYGVMYEALNVVNAPDLEERCRVKNARRAIYVIKANARSNNDMCLSLRAGLQNGNINLLIDEQEGERAVSTIRGYGQQTDTMKASMQMPYLETTFLVDELINLTYELTGGLIKVKERPGMRKDRYSSLMYGYYVIQELGKGLRPRTDQTNDILSKFKIRPGVVKKTFG